jgi:plastocyanin
MKSKWFVRPLLVVLAFAALATLAAACGGTTPADGGNSSTPAAASPATSPAAATPTETPTSTGGDDDTSTGGVKVTIADSAFSPLKIEVPAGTTVTWTNNDAVPHTVTSTKSDDVDSATSGLFDSGTLQTGESFSYTFKKAGDYPYECTIHATMPSMHDKVEVK